jgi:hypothetical protein
LESRGTNGRGVLANRIDIIIKNKTDKMLLIDGAVPSDRNITQREAENKLKYKNLSKEFQRMWNMKCFVIPAITRATGIINIGLKKSVNNNRKAFSRFLKKRQLY